jgi:bacterioferritin-associated ferredoxin
MSMCVCVCVRVSEGKIEGEVKESKGKGGRR